MSDRLKSKRQRETVQAYAMLSPALLLILVFFLLPLVWNLLLSLFSGGFLGDKKWVGLQNYATAFHNPVFVQALVNTARYAVVAIPGSVLAGLVAAVLIEELPRGKGFFRGLLYLPVLASPVVVANIWAYVVGRDAGPLNYVLGSLGLPKPDWLGNVALAMPVIAVEEIWRGFGFFVLVFSAALSAIPKEIYEAARLDGARSPRIFFSITVPLIAPSIGFATVMATIWALQVFDVIYVLTKGGPAGSTTSLSWYVYRQAFSYDNIGFASTMSVVLMLVMLPIAYIQMRITRQRFSA